MTESVGERLIGVLSAPNSPLRAEGVGLFVDHALAHTLRQAVDLQDIHALVLTALTHENLGRIVAQHVQPAWQRYCERAPALDACVGDLVAHGSRSKLHQVAEQLSLPRVKWAQGALDPALLRKLLGPVWVQVLLNFAKRMPIPGVGGAGGTPSMSGPAAMGRGFAGMLRSSVQQQAERLVDAGRSVMEGLGIDVEKRLLAAARDFSDNALAVWSAALRERLDSDEGRALLAEINIGLVEHVLRTQFRDLQLDAAELPIDRVLELVPELVAHASRSAFVQDIVKRELAAYLAIEGDRRISELLRELGVFDEVRSVLVARGDELLRSLAESDAFADWIGRLLDA
jgi:hypothetical protein